MLPDDINDSIWAVVLLVALAVIVAVSGSFGGNTYTGKDVNLNDEQNLFLLNYLRTETDSGKISDLIALNEGGDYTTLTPLKKITEGIINFYGFKNKDYILKAGYPDGKVDVITANGKFNLPSAGTGLAQSDVERLREQSKTWSALGEGYKIKIPSKRGGLITVEFELENG